MTTLDAALDYHSRGLPITLCDGKQPLGLSWQNKRWSASEIKAAYRNNASLNVGCRWGRDSGMIDLECDSPEAEKSLLELLDGDPPVTPTFQSTRGRHRLFLWHDDLDGTGLAKLSIGKLDVLTGAGGKGAQSLLPPSMTSDFQRAWLVGLDECDPAPLPKSALRRLLSYRPQTTAIPLYTEAQAICVSVSLCKATVRVIEATMPTEEGYRHRQLFRLAQLLKGIPQYAKAGLSEVKPVLVEWHRRALPVIGTKDFLTTWAEFATAWRNVKYPSGEEPIRMVMRQALSKPLPAAAERYAGSPAMQALVALCAELQIAAGSEPFFLACRPAGELIGVSHVQANQWLNLLVDEGVLKIETRGQRNRAAEYRFIG